MIRIGVLYGLNSCYWGFLHVQIQDNVACRKELVKAKMYCNGESYVME